jgi:hypothetical protein
MSFSLTSSPAILQVDAAATLLLREKAGEETMGAVTREATGSGGVLNGGGGARGRILEEIAEISTSPILGRISLPHNCH